MAQFYVNCLGCSFCTYSSDFLYSFEASNTSDNGVIHVNKILKDSSFYDAIEKVSDVPETYTLTKDVIAYKDSTTLNGVDLTVTGEGTDYTISGSGKGCGGMQTKLIAAKISTSSGVSIPNGSKFIEMDTKKVYMYDAENSQWLEW